MRRSCRQPLSELLPHGHDIILLNEVLSWDIGFISTSVHIRDNILFYQNKYGVPSYVGLEYMAQACGVCVGLEARRTDGAVRMGFLLGTRNFHASNDWFIPGSKLIVNAQEVVRENLMAIFDCRILCDEVEIASAQLNLYQPENIEEILSGKTKN